MATADFAPLYDITGASPATIEKTLKAADTPKAVNRRAPLIQKATAANDRLRQERIRQAQEAQKTMEGNPSLAPDPFVHRKNTRKRLQLNKPSRFNETQAIEEASNEELNTMMAADAEKSQKLIKERIKKARFG